MVKLVYANSQISKQNIIPFIFSGATNLSVVEMNDIWSCKMEKKSLIVLDFLWADDVRTLYDENVFACNCDKFGTLSAFVTTKKNN